jgi:hypothetical protein
MTKNTASVYKFEYGLEYHLNYAQGDMVLDEMTLDGIILNA